ncbi:F0F1 ATP synthase subunit epsilon [Gryllotalpicola protaetiae]|uniref:F0F1 ATP synthase subunit epsilon n=1 Tax=Gryllotalpicola protaetiae TaxID=2419771 RepID=A0A387BTN7_9MICO|nr:F0F1 ATP synthase subunit epsilon [Gryllotalpicola protaetiae]AYG04430.1 F0F1 ATP synthase subunit epsilon [Gryllotalpicola protaetiae]
MAKLLNVSVVAADHKVWSGEASMVVAKTTIGEIGVLAGHEPVLALLARGGQVRLTLPGGERITANAEGGYFSVAADIVTIVASQAELV